MKIYRFTPSIPYSYGFTRNSRRISLFVVLVGALLVASCDMFTYDLKTFLEEQTGSITVKAIVPVSDTLALGSDGYVCIAEGVDSFSIPIDNPLGYALVVDYSFTQTQNPGGEISGLTVNQEGADRLVVNIPSGNMAGNEGGLHIKVKTKKEGRLLYEGDLDLAFILFSTALKAGDGLRVSSALDLTLQLDQTFDPANQNYSIIDAPIYFVVIAEAENPAAQVIINGEPGSGSKNLTLTPPAGPSTVTIRVEAPHGVDYGEILSALPGASGHYHQPGTGEKSVRHSVRREYGLRDRGPRNNRLYHQLGCYRPRRAIRYFGL
jgi:hypothetical protein